MVPTTDLVGQRLCLLLTGVDDEGEPEWLSFPGTVIELPDGLFLDRGEREPPVELREEWLSRVQLVPPDLSREFREAKFYIRLYVGRAEDEPDHETFVPTGLRYQRRDTKDPPA